MDIALVADVEKKMIFRSLKDVMERDRQLDHPEVGTEMAAVLGQDRDHFLADLLRQQGQISDRELLQIGRRIDPIE